jgi:hypothetical protein
MNTKVLYRLSGISLTLAGLLIGVGLALHHNQVTSATIATSRWAFVHIAAGFGLLLSLFGLFAVFSRQNERPSFWGLLSFVIVVLSTAVMGAVTLVFEGLLSRALIGRGIMLDEFMVPGQPFFLGFLITLLLFALGYVILGVVTFRVNSLCWFASVLLVISTPVIVLGLTVLPMVLFRIGGAIFGLAFIRLGTVLWSTAEIPTGRFATERLAPA